MNSARYLLSVGCCKATKGTPLEMCSISETYNLVKLWASYEIIQSASWCLALSSCSTSVTHKERGDEVERGVHDTVWTI